MRKDREEEVSQTSLTSLTSLLSLLPVGTQKEDVVFLNKLIKLNQASAKQKTVLDSAHAGCGIQGGCQ